MLNVLLFAGMMALVYAECPNACSSHGRCSAYDSCICYRNWGSNDCSERKYHYLWSLNAHMVAIFCHIVVGYELFWARFYGSFCELTLLTISLVLISFLCPLCLRLVSLIHRYLSVRSCSTLILL